MDIIPLSALNKSHRQLIGGKGYALGQLISLGYNVPPGFCVTTLLYDQFLDQTGPVKYQFLLMKTVLLEKQAFLNEINILASY